MTGLCDLVFDFFLATLTTDRIGFRRRSISPEGAQEYVAVPAVRAQIPVYTRLHSECHCSRAQSAETCFQDAREILD
jgi:hypothetical protein